MSEDRAAPGAAAAPDADPALSYDAFREMYLRRRQAELEQQAEAARRRREAAAVMRAMLQQPPPPPPLWERVRRLGARAAGWAQAHVRDELLANLVPDWSFLLQAALLTAFFGAFTVYSFVRVVALAYAFRLACTLLASLRWGADDARVDRFSLAGRLFAGRRDRARRRGARLSRAEMSAYVAIKLAETFVRSVSPHFSAAALEAELAADGILVPDEVWEAAAAAARAAAAGAPPAPAGAPDAAAAPPAAPAAGAANDRDNDEWEDLPDDDADAAGAGDAPHE